MDPVGPDRQNISFSRSNEPRCRQTPHFADFQFRCYFSLNFSWTSVKTLSMEPVGPDSQNGPFPWLNDLQSR
ncbi:hypothetical protein H5410_052997 [Solanum commersonii]|uniref:Uncharacterized protein n=1 Tax=Solanum commersonii TaxID=4109 RepID=A0A9J5X341_SOLCO|nr:hypothetical protein H5410_052997 [Solanum commersonii]